MVQFQDAGATKPRKVTVIIPGTKATKEKKIIAHIPVEQATEPPSLWELVKAEKAEQARTAKLLQNKPKKR